MRDTMNILFLMGPAFMRMGQDLMEQIKATSDADVTFTVLNSGDDRHRRRILARFPEGVEVLNLAELEKEWFTAAVTTEQMTALETTYGPGILGRTILSDRRICGGFVNQPVRHTALPKDWLTDSAKTHYVCNLYSYLEKIILKADLVFCYAVAGAPAFAIGNIAKNQDIPFQQFSPLRIKNYYGLDQEINDRLENLAAREPDTESIYKSRVFLSEYRKRPSVPEYQVSLTGKNKSKILLRQRQALIRLISKTFQYIRSPSRQRALRVKNQFQEFIFEVRAVFDKENLKKLDGGLPSRFWYFPLQVEPEATTMILAPWLSNQELVIELIAKSLPPGVSLLVKEHPSMLGRRRPGYYKRLRSFPNVELVDSSRSQFHLMEKAELSIVNTGTPVPVNREAPYKIERRQNGIELGRRTIVQRVCR